MQIIQKLSFLELRPFHLNTSSYLLMKKNFFSGRAVLQWHSCPGSGGVTVPGGAPELWGCGTEGGGYGHGGMGLGILEVFSNLIDPMILSCIIWLKREAVGELLRSWVCLKCTVLGQHGEVCRAAAALS